MRKLYIALLTLLIVIASLSQTNTPESYSLKPLELSTTELKAIDLARFFETNLFYEYHVPKKYKYVGLAIVGYTDGKPFNEEYSMVELLDEHDGVLVININTINDFHVKFKNRNSVFDYIGELTVPRSDLHLRHENLVLNTLYEESTINDNGEIIITAYQYKDEYDKQAGKYLLNPNELTDEEMKGYCAAIKIKFFE